MEDWDWNWDELFEVKDGQAVQPQTNADSVQSSPKHMDTSLDQTVTDGARIEPGYPCNDWNWDDLLELIGDEADQPVINTDNNALLNQDSNVPPISAVSQNDDRMEPRSQYVPAQFCQRPDTTVPVQSDPKPHNMDTPSGQTHTIEAQMQPNFQSFGQSSSTPHASATFHNPVQMKPTVQFMPAQVPSQAYGPAGPSGPVQYGPMFHNMNTSTGQTHSNEAQMQPSFQSFGQISNTSHASATFHSVVQLESPVQLMPAQRPNQASGVTGPSGPSQSGPMFHNMDTSTGQTLSNVAQMQSKFQSFGQSSNIHASATFHSVVQIKSPVRFLPAHRPNQASDPNGASGPVQFVPMKHSNMDTSLAQTVTNQAQKKGSHHGPAHGKFHHSNQKSGPNYSSSSGSLNVTPSEQRQNVKPPMNSHTSFDQNSNTPHASATFHNPVTMKPNYQFQGSFQQCNPAGGPTGPSGPGFQSFGQNSNTAHASSTIHSVVQIEPTVQNMPTEGPHQASGPTGPSGPVQFISMRSNMVTSLGQNLNNEAQMQLNPQSFGQSSNTPHATAPIQNVVQMKLPVQFIPAQGPNQASDPTGPFGPVQFISWNPNMGTSLDQNRHNQTQGPAQQLAQASGPTSTSTTQYASPFEHNRTTFSKFQPYTMDYWFKTFVHTWKPIMTAEEIKRAEGMDIFLPRRQKHVNLPRVDSDVKNYLLQFVELPEDATGFHAGPAQNRIIARIKHQTGRDIEPSLIVKLVYTIRRQHKDKQREFEEFNRELFEDLNWDFRAVEDLPEYDNNKFQS